MVPRDRENCSDDEHRPRNSNFFWAQSTTTETWEMIYNSPPVAAADESRTVPMPKRNNMEHHRQKPDSFWTQTPTPKAMETIYITPPVATADKSWVVP